MESSNNFKKTFQTEDSRKTDIEHLHNINHSKMVNNFIYSKRTMNTHPISIKITTNRKSASQSLNSNLFFNNIDEISILFNKLHQNNFFILNTINKAEINSSKNSLFEYLKQIRKELSKENISLVEVKTIFENEKTHNFIDLIINQLLSSNDPYIELELLWILNNLIYLIAKFNLSFDITKVSEYLLKYLISLQKSQKNEGVKYTLEEKILRIFGNIIYLYNNIIDILINNNLINFIIDSLISPVSSFRTTCLWLLNKFLIILKKLDGNKNNYINYFTNKQAISNYKFIFNRIVNQKNFDEIGELFWLLNELAKYDSSILVPIFFTDINNINNNNFNNNNLSYINKDFAIKNFEFVLDNCLTVNLLQACFRLISNLLVVCHYNVNNEDLLKTFIETLFEKQTVLWFIKDVLNSPKNKYETPLVKDILLLIFNLSFLFQVKSSVLFRSGIVNLISNKDYQNDTEIIKLLFFIYYRMLLSNSYFFEQNEEKVIKACLIVKDRFKNDSSILIIFIDILYFYLKASNIQIGNDVENELNLMVNYGQNIHVDRLQSILLKLSNFL